jgi:hypothetical protein
MPFQGNEIKGLDMVDQLSCPQDYPAMYEDGKRKVATKCTPWL